jgi:hypothetical protein
VRRPYLAAWLAGVMLICYLVLCGALWISNKGMP